uniref:Uncharacterized protein n=2 Tax=Physcomitrium patens TaxID=3218 RepID=A0A7I4BCM0_PHYPA
MENFVHTPHIKVASNAHQRPFWAMLPNANLWTHSEFPPGPIRNKQVANRTKPPGIEPGPIPRGFGNLRRVKQGSLGGKGRVMPARPGLFRPSRPSSPRTRSGARVLIAGLISASVSPSPLLWELRCAAFAPTLVIWSPRFKGPSFGEGPCIVVSVGTDRVDATVLGSEAWLCFACVLYFGFGRNDISLRRSVFHTHTSIYLSIYLYIYIYNHTHMFV